MKLHIEVLTPRDLVSPKDGEQFLQLLKESVPAFMPEYIGNFEPISTAFDPANLDEALKLWTAPFFWRRKRPKVLGSVFMTLNKRRFKHGHIKIASDTRNVDMGAVTRFVQEVAKVFCADFAYIHLLTEPDIKRGYLDDTVFNLDREGTKNSMNITTWQLIMYLPNLYWATILGPAYVKHFGKEKLMAAPAPIVRELAKDMVYLGLSDNIFDFATNFDEVDALREGIKDHLGRDAFFSPEHGPDYPYWTPSFMYPEEKAPE